MASTPPTQQCPCSTPCAFISSCPHAGALASGLERQYCQLKLSEVGSTTTTTSASPKTTKVVHNFPDQYTSITTEVPYYQNPACSSGPSTPVPEIKTADTEKKLDEIQKKEEYLIDTYTEVFDMLEVKYRGLERVLKWETKNAFEEGVLRAVMASVRECMGMNELAMEEGRRVLWGQAFEEEGESGDGDADIDAEVEGFEAQENVGVVNGGEEGQIEEEVKEKVEVEQEWEQI